MNASLQLIRQVLPSVVHIKARIPDQHPSATLLGTEREGTGTVVDRTGLVLTANYVVLGAEAVSLTRMDGEIFPAEIVGRDFAAGLAVLRASDTVARPLPLVDSSELALGDEVFLIGSGGDSGPRVDSGGVSSLAPFDAYWEYVLERAILTTAMNPGLGGGPLCDRFGRMAGVVSLSLSEVGRFTMAIPIECFLEHRDDLIRSGRPVKRPGRAWIGLFATILHDHVVVAGLMPSSPAESAGLRSGDVVLAVDGVSISDRVSLYRQIWTHGSGERVTFTVFRSNQVLTVEVRSADVETIFA